MNLRRKIAVTVSALAMTVGGGILTAPPAAADEPCGSNKLCLYRSTLYRTMEFSTGSVNDCWMSSAYNLTDPYAGIMSYRNNLGVKATLWYYGSGAEHAPSSWIGPVVSIAPGGASSNTTGGDAVFNFSTKICTGSQKPWVF
ncbi:peptidase inhibitor [Streptomyces uncialis]|uniref:peptidase inhibitor n=1 Tax=Streptomyces uncialis TaxID=1048205 RepID=UPI003805DF75